MTQAQTVPGTYALMLVSAVETSLQIGRLGQLHVQPGFYVYVGSAFGPGGVPARVSHHRRLALRPHWHIDYLRAVTRLAEIWYTHDATRREHQWADVFQSLLGASMPVQKFGTSDCSCVSHLYFFPRRPSLRAFRTQLRHGFPDHSLLQADRVQPLQEHVS